VTRPASHHTQEWFTNSEFVNHSWVWWLSKSSHSWVIHELSVAVLGCLMSKSSHSEFVNHSWVWWLSKSSHSWVIQELSVAVPGCTTYLQICQKRLYSWIQVEWVSFSSHELLLSLILESRTSLLSLILESRTSAESHSRTSVESILESQTSVESHSQVTNICGVSFSSHELLWSLILESRTFHDSRMRLCRILFPSHKL